MTSNAALAAALEHVSAAQAELSEQLATLRRDYATLASLVTATQVTAPKPKAEMPSGPARIVHADNPKGSGVRCPRIKGNGKQCRQTLDATGCCPYHGKAGGEATAKAEPVATPKAKREASAPTPGGPYAFGDVACKGHKANGDPCGVRFVNGKGYCKHHHTQVKGRSKTAK